MHTLAGWWKKPQKNLSLQKRRYGMWTFSESETWSFQEVTGRQVAHKTAEEKPFASSDSACQEHISSHSSSHRRRIVVKSRPTALNLSSAKKLITSKSPGILMATGKLERRMRGNSESDAAPSSQVQLKDAYFGGLMDDSAVKLVATEENQVLWEVSESESWSVHEDEVTGKLVAWKKRARGNLRLPVLQKMRKSWSWKKEVATQFLHILWSRVLHGEGLFDCERDLRSRTYREMKDLKLNAAIWRMFMNTTLQAAVHLGQNYDQNLRFVKNHFWSSLKKLFKETENFDQEPERDHWCTNDWLRRAHMERDKLAVWQYSSDLECQDTYVFADSVLCLRDIKENPNEACKDKIK